MKVNLRCNWKVKLEDNYSWNIWLWEFQWEFSELQLKQAQRLKTWMSGDILRRDMSLIVCSWPEQKALTDWCSPLTLQLGKLRLREKKGLAQGHTSKQSQERRSELSTPSPVLLPIDLLIEPLCSWQGSSKHECVSDRYLIKIKKENINWYRGLAGDAFCHQKLLKISSSCRWGAPTPS